jgi:hypothetical protein
MLDNWQPTTNGCTPPTKAAVDEADEYQVCDGRCMLTVSLTSIIGRYHGKSAAAAALHISSICVIQQLASLHQNVASMAVLKQMHRIQSATGKPHVSSGGCEHHALPADHTSACIVKKGI